MNNFNSSLSIAFVVNPLGMEGLGATLLSMLLHCTDMSRLRLHFIGDGLTTHHQQMIIRLLTTVDFDGQLEFIPFRAKDHFGHLRSLHGDWTAYGCLLIPKLIDADRVLYLDSDMLICRDVLAVLSIPHNGKALGAVRASSAQYALESNFYIRTLGCAPDMPTFNSGVLWINVKQWKAQQLDQKINVLGARHGTHLLTADQSLLNALMQGDFIFLPLTYNVECSPTSVVACVVPDESIVHFFGSPKPWDYMGAYIHPAYKLWERYQLDFWRTSSKTQRWRRSWHIRRSIARALIHKLFPVKSIRSRSVTST
jgi:lipopolysaccharide biosynthesis glycosyltransferase